MVGSASIVVVVVGVVIFVGQWILFLWGLGVNGVTIVVKAILLLLVWGW